MIARGQPFSIGEVADMAKGVLFGDPDVLISGVAEITDATAGDVTYAVNSVYVKRLKDCRATAAIVPRGTSERSDGSMVLIETDAPYWSFAQILTLFQPTIPHGTSPSTDPTACIADDAIVAPDAAVGPFAVIDGKARIGARTYIGPGCHIGHECVIGDDCRLHHNVTIRDFCEVGNRVTIHAGSVIGSDGYGFVQHEGAYHKIPQIGIVEIHDDVEIGSLVCIDRATIGKTVIGRGTKMDNLIQIGHNVVLGEHCAVVSQVGISGSTKVGPHCRFAGQSATSGHLTIGAHSTIAARGVAVRDLPPHSFVSGFPARPHKEERRILAALPRLPELFRRLTALEKRFGRASESEDVDSSADDNE